MSIAQLKPRQPNRGFAGRFAWLRDLDWVLLAAALALSLMGAMLVWSATRAQMTLLGQNPQTYLRKHLLNLSLGLMLGYGFSRLDVRRLRAYVPFIYAPVVLGLLVVLSPIGSTINGSKAWISLPAGFTVQPSEFAKVAVVLVLAVMLSERRDAERQPRPRDITAALCVAAIPIALILLEPDLGSSLIAVIVVPASLAASGVPVRWLWGLFAGAAVTTYVVIHVHLVKPYQLDRLTAFTDPAGGSRTYGYNTQQARIAIGSGGWFGEGLFRGSQTQGRFVPYNQTDFVYSVAGEELGFVGAAIIIGLAGIVCWRALRSAWRATDLFGRLTAAGIGAWFAFQTFENIGMNLGIMPVTGVPLPFVSYGGTSMFVSWIAIGILQSVHLRSKQNSLS